MTASRRIGIVVLGTRGDIEPHLALALALARAGASPVVIGFTDEGETARALGVEYRPLPVRLQDLLGSDDGRAFATTRNPVRLLRAQRSLVDQTPRELVSVITEALADCDAVVAGGPTSAPSLFSAEALDLPSMMTMLQPMYPTSQLAPFIAPRASLGPLNRPLWSGMLRAQWALQGKLIDRWRAESGLAPFKSLDGFRAYVMSHRVIAAWSLALLPAPADWPAQVLRAGRMAVTDDRGLDAEVQQFIDEGAAPVYAGLGSMVVPNPDEVTAMLVQAARGARRRLILSRGWAGLGASASDAGSGTARPADDVLVVGSVPHSALLPQCAAVIHHSGAGTTQATAAAGVPAVPLPFGMDQPFWARLVWRAGIAGRPVPIHRWSTERVERSLHEALAARCRGQALAMAERMRAEPDGATSAAEQILRHVR